MLIGVRTSSEGPVLRMPTLGGSDTLNIPKIQGSGLGMVNIKE